MRLKVKGLNQTKPVTFTKMKWCRTSAVGSGSEDSVSGFGLLSEEDSPPCFCESMTCSAICRPILLTSMCVFIICCMSLPFAGRKAAYQWVRYNHKEATYFD